MLIEEKYAELIDIAEAVRLHHIQEKKFNTNLISVLWTIPANRDTATGMALLAEALRLGKDGNRDELEKKLAEMYGAVLDTMIIKKGGRQLLNINIEFVTDNVASEKVYKNAVQLMKDIINSKIAQLAFDQAKSRLQTSLLQRNDLASEYTIDRLVDIVYPDDDFSIHGDGYIEDIEKVRLSDLNDLFMYLKVSAHTGIFISGDVEREKAIKTAHEIIGRREDVEKLSIDEVNISRGCAEKNEIRNIGQSRLAIAYTTDLKAWGKDWLSALIIREVLCGSGLSLLYDNVRQKEGLCYYIGAKLMRFRMLYIIDAGVSLGHEESVVNMVHECIENISINDEQLKRAKGAILYDFKASQDRRTGLINETLNDVLLGVTIEHNIEDELNEIKLDEINSKIKNLNKKGVFILSGNV